MKKFLRFGLVAAFLCSPLIGQSANEATVQVQFVFAKNGARIERQLSDQITVTGAAMQAGVISVGTSDETVAKGDVGTIGVVYVHNMDATNYISVGSDGTNYPLKIKAGEVQVFRWNATDIHVKANTAACRLEFILVED